MPDSEIPNEEAGLLIDNLDAGNLVAQLDKLEGSDKVDAKSNTHIYNEITALHTKAKGTMEKWDKRYCKALKLAKMQPTMEGNDIESKDFPFEGASTAMVPYIFEAMLDFHGRATPDLVWTNDLVKTKINGSQPLEFKPDPQMPPEQVQQAQAQAKAQSEQLEERKEQRATRVSDYSNYQLINDIPLWRDSTDKALLALPCVGTYYKKTYYDSDLGQICSDFRTADKVVFDMECESFTEAPDKFEEVSYSRNELIAYIRGDQQWDIEESDLEKDKNSFDFIEAHTWIDLDEDGIKEPYCAILYPAKNKIVSLYPDYDEELITSNESGELIRIKDKEIYTQSIFLPDPEGGPMGLGWGILLGSMFQTINTLLRDNIDAGTLNNVTANSGLIATGIGKGRGNRQQAGPIDIKLGQLTPVDMGGTQGTLQQNVVNLPFSGPSGVLFDLMSFLIDSSKTMTTAAYSVEANTGEAASLYLARLQQGLKVPNSIVMRVYGSQKKEFEKIGLLNFKHHDSEQYNKVLDLPQEANMRADFDPEDCDIDLVADPSQGSDVERVGKAQQVVDQGMNELAASGRTQIDMRVATTKLFEALGVDDIDEILPEPPPRPTEEEKQQQAMQQKQMEFQERDMAVKEQELQLKSFKQEADKLKQAHDSAIELGKLGLQADIDESVITKNYAEALAKLVDKAGLSYMQAKSEVIALESEMIDAEGGMNGQAGISAINGAATRDMAR